MTTLTGPGDMLRIQTPDNVDIRCATAGVGSRLVAQLLDSLVAGTAVVIATVIYVGIATSGGGQRPSPLAITGAVAVGFFVYLGYFAVSEMASGGSTLGKSSMGLRVIRLDGGAPRPAELAIRNVMRIVDIGGAGIGLIVMFFHPQCRRLGDLAAGTLVMRSRSTVSLASASRGSPVFLRTPDPGPAIDGIARLGAHERSILRAFLSRPSLAPEQRQALAWGMAQKLHDRLGLTPAAPERGWPPELFLERLYLQLAQRGV